MEKVKYKIWRKDNFGWSIAFDTLFESKEKADEHIAELNAVYHEKVNFGELSFYPYRENIKLSKDGNIIDPNIPIYKKHRKYSKNNRRH
ncbi:MAG: hypothetical protein WC942_07395 [Clostridia bacterium]|jgi:hypothetical protein